MTHTGIPAGDATVLWTQVATLLALAWLLGAAARRVGQPPIVGSLVAGLLAGPSVFGQVWPAGFHWFRPGTQFHAGLLASIADFSLLVLLIALGAETDLALIRRLGRSAAAVVSGSLVLPLAAGVGMALLLPTAFMGPHGRRSSFVLLVAAAMAVSSLPVIARILSEMGITRRDVGQLSIAAATINDAVGFLVLALATALVSGGGSGKLVLAVVGLAALLAVLASVGTRGVDLLLRRSRREGPNVGGGVGVAVVFMLVVAAVAQALGVDAALGAFLAGIVIGRSRYLAPAVLDAITWTSDAVFAPLYFATAGVSVDITLLGRDSAAGWLAAIIAVAAVSKFVGVYVGARAARVPARGAAGLGVALNGRGALQVILATAGLSAGVLTPTAFTMLIVLSIVSSVAVPPALRHVITGWRGTDEEQERLEHEEEMATNIVVRGQRLLLPTRGSANSVAAARVMDLAWPPDSEFTLLQVAPERRDEQGLANVRETLAARQVHEREASEGDVVEAILAEANVGYGAIGVGAAETPTAERMLPEFIEDLFNRSPIPLVVVRRGTSTRNLGGRPLIRPRRILVPVTGNAASQAGQEVAHMIGRNTGAHLNLIHVVTRPGATTGDASAVGAAAIVDQARRHAEDKQLDPQVQLRDGPSSGEQIAEEVKRTGADIVVVGTTVRRVGDKPFLGHTVAHLLENVSGPTLVVVVLPDAQQAAADQHIDRRAG